MAIKLSVVLEVTVRLLLLLPVIPYCPSTPDNEQLTRIGPLPAYSNWTTMYRIACPALLPSPTRPHSGYRAVLLRYLPPPHHKTEYADLI